LATAACLIGAAAYAQPASTTDAASPAASDSQPMPPATADTGTATTPADMAAPTGAASNTSATVSGGTEVVASQPVPDTPANRKAFGSPLSRAGKMTRPAGN
jgi:hypothetical protein